MFKKIRKRIFNGRYRLQGACKPLVNFHINSLGEYSGVNEATQRSPMLIVSLTSNEEQFKDLPQTLYSLLNQSLKPDKLILWLDEKFENSTNLPYEITQFVKNGLEIRFVKNIKSYTKVIYAFKEFFNEILVTADDNIYYPTDWLKKLYLSYVAHPENVHVHKAYKVQVCTDKKISINTRSNFVKEEVADYKNFPVSYGGILYPPNCFSKEALRQDIFLRYAPNAEEVWFWIMAIINNKKVRVVKNHIKVFSINNIFNQMAPKNLFYHNKNGGYNKQLSNLMKFYASNILSKINS